MNPHHPLVQKGLTAKRTPKHWLLVRLYRVINRMLRASIPLETVEMVPRMVDADPLIDKVAGVVYCSAAQYDELRKAVVVLPAQSTGQGAEWDTRRRP